MKRLWLAVVLLALSSEALAAKSASVTKNGATLQSNPNKNSDVIAQLNAGDSIQISNFPTEGFYKARTSSGQLGWIDAHAISADMGEGTEEEIPAPSQQENPPAPAAPSAPAAPARPTTLSSPARSHSYSYEDVKPGRGTEEVEEKEAAPVMPRVPVELKIFGGMEKVTMTDLNNLIGATPFSSVTYFGAQIGIPFDRRFRALIRIESMKKSASVAQDNFEISSLPVMGGASYDLVDPDQKQNSVSFQVSFLIGPTLSTSLSATDTSQQDPNRTEFSTTGLSEILKFDLGIPLGKVVGIFAEGGYRFFKTPSVGPSTVNNGGTIFQKNGVTVPIPLDLSGPFIGGGLQFLF